MKKVIALVMLSSVVAAGAFAQVGKPAGISVRAGAIFPTSKAARNLDNTWFGFGAEYKLKDLDMNFNNPAYSASLSLSLDYYAKDDARATPLLLNYVGRQNQAFYSAGVGIGLNRDLNGSTKNKFAYQVSAGYDFAQGTTPLFVEAKYFGFADSSRLNAFGVYVGVRF